MKKEGPPTINIFERAETGTRQFSYTDSVTKEVFHGEREVAVLQRDGMPTTEYPLSWKVFDQENQLRQTSKREWIKLPNGHIRPIAEMTDFPNGKSRRIEARYDEEGNEIEGMEYQDGKLTYQQKTEYENGKRVFLEQEYHDPKTGKLIEKREFRATDAGIIEQSFYDEEGKTVPGERQLRPSWHSGYRGHLEYAGYLLMP